MMIALLDDYLRHTVSADMRETITEACEHFEQFQLEGYEDEYVEILSDTGSHDESTTVDLLLDLTKAYQQDVLRKHGIQPNEHLRISQANLLLKALYEIPAYLNGEEILGLCGHDTSAEEIVAEIIALVIGQEVESVMSWLDAVSPALVGTIAAWVDNAHQDLDLELVKQKELRVEAFQWYVDHFHIEALKLAYLIDHGLDVNHPARLYLNVLGPDFNQMELDAILHEFFAIALISADYATQPAALINEYAETYIADPDMVTRLIVKSHEVALIYAQEGPKLTEPQK